MIPVLVDAGYRVIAPDMVGFGKSDKYISVEDYTHQMHVDKMTQLIVELDLNNITAMCMIGAGSLDLELLLKSQIDFLELLLPTLL